MKQIVGIFMLYKKVESDIVANMDKYDAVRRLIRLVDNWKDYSTISMIGANLGYNAERFSDSFATYNGFGPELISGFRKMDESDTGKSGSLLLDSASWVGSAAQSILHVVIDPHPETQTRARMALDELEKLADSSDVHYLTPTSKKLLKKDVEEARKNYEMWYKNTDEDKSILALKTSRLIKEKVFFGKVDLRQLIFKGSAVDTGYGWVPFLH